MKKILVALDYNPSAQKVAEMGNELAKAMNAQMTLLHVVSDITYYSSLNYSPIMGFEGFNSPGMLDTDTIAVIKKAAQDYLDKSKSHLGDPTIETAVRNGEFGQTILDTAEEINADIIVIGTHSKRGLEKILMGSVAESVFHHSTIPVFIIPTKAYEEKK